MQSKTSLRSLFSYLHMLITWHSPHSPTACCSCSNRSISPAYWAQSSKPVAAGLLRFIDSALPTMWAEPINMSNIHAICITRLLTHHTWLRIDTKQWFSILFQQKPSHCCQGNAAKNYQKHLVTVCKNWHDKNSDLTNMALHIKS